MEKIESTIRQYGQKRDSDNLQKYIQTINTEKLTALISQRIQHPNFTSFFHYLLEGIVDSEEKRYKVIFSVITKIEDETLSDNVKSKLVLRIFDEIEKLKSNELIELCSFCTTAIMKGSSSILSLKELFPELLSLITKREYVKFNDEEMTGLQYKSQLIDSVLMMDWSANNITSLADMFKSMPLTKEEHTKVVYKLVQCVDKLTIQEIPAYVYQLLRLCKNQNSKSIFMSLQNYFGTKIYSKDMNVYNNSDSIDIIECSSELDAIQAESTVLLHIYDAATSDFDLKDYLNSLKNLTKSPEVIIHPFQLTVLLTLSTIPSCEERVFEILKSSFSRMYSEDTKKLESCWFREMVPQSQQLESVIIKIASSAEDRDLVLQGLINLSFILLSSGGILGREYIASKLWDAGNLILMRLIKEKRHIANTILQRLADYIMIYPNVYQHIQCLHILVRKYGLVMLENQSLIVQLMEQVIVQPGQTANEILNAILPLTKISPTLRDYMILLLRKALFSRVIETRQIAVVGFLKLLQHLRITNLSVLSQSNRSSSSGHSVLTQISLTLTGHQASSAFTNEALCLEVLNILRRCFMHHAADVKMKLYEGLYEAICVNPDLSASILELFVTHFDLFYEIEDDILPPIKFSKVVQLRETDAIIVEPIGKLLYAIGLVFSKIMEMDGFNNNNPVNKRLLHIFNNISRKMAICELEHFQLDDGTNLTDILPESQEKVLILKESLSVYEALIGYNISSWNANSENTAETINRLFTAYNRLLLFTKNVHKPKKGDKKKKGDISQSLNGSKKDGAAKKVIKLPDTILDIKTVTKMLTFLHEVSVTWTSQEDGVVIKTNKEIHAYFLQVAINITQQYKNLKKIDLQKKNNYYTYLTNIATTLYNRCVSRFKDCVKFDSTTAVMSVECLYIIFQAINKHHKDEWTNFLKAVGGTHTEDVIQSIEDIIDVYKILFNTIDDSVLDAETVKFSSTVINTIRILAAQIHGPSNFASNNLLDWMYKFAADKRISSKLVLNSFIEFLFKFHVKYKSTTTIFKNIAIQLSIIFGTIADEVFENSENIEIINEETANSILIYLCNEIKCMLDDVDWIVVRLKSDYIVITYPGEDSVERRREYLKSKEKSICCQLCQIITIMNIVSSMSAPLGPCSEAIIKIITHLFTTLNNLTKYFLIRSTKINIAFQSACFEGVVKHAGKHLSETVYNFILYIDKCQMEQILSPQKKQKDTNMQKTKVLRETRLIPKLIYEMELFSKTVIQLSKKTKVDLAKFVGQGTSRDFRILELKTALDNRKKARNEDSDNESAMDGSVSVNLDEISEQHVSDIETENASDEPILKKKKK